MSGCAEAWDGIMSSSSLMGPSKWPEIANPSCAAAMLLALQFRVTAKAAVRTSALANQGKPRPVWCTPATWIRNVLE